MVLLSAVEFDATDLLGPAEAGVASAVGHVVAVVAGVFAVTFILKWITVKIREAAR